MSCQARSSVDFEKIIQLCLIFELLNFYQYCVCYRYILNVFRIDLSFLEVEIIIIITIITVNCPRMCV